MGKKRSVKLLWQKTSPVTKAVILSAVVLSLVALVALYSAIGQLTVHYNDLRQQAMELESNQSQLEEKIDSLGTPDSIFRIARDELGLRFPDSIIYTPGD